MSSSDRVACPFPPRMPACCRFSVRGKPHRDPMPEPIELGQWRAEEPGTRRRSGFPFIFVRRQDGDGIAHVPMFELACFDHNVLQRVAQRGSARYVTEQWPIVLPGRPAPQPFKLPEANPEADLPQARPAANAARNALLIAGLLTSGIYAGPPTRR